MLKPIDIYARLLSCMKRENDQIPLMLILTK